MDPTPTTPGALSCPACGAPASGKFCSECAHPLDPAPGAETILREDVKEVAGFDLKILRTLRDLLLRPARVVRSYVEGRREYFPPLRLFFWLGGAYMVLLSLVQPFPFDPERLEEQGIPREHVQVIQEKMEARGVTQELLQERYTSRMNATAPLVVALSILPLAGLLRLLNRRRPFQEHLLFMVAVSNAVWLVSILAVPLTAVSAGLHSVVMIVASYVYLGIGYFAVNREPSRLATSAKFAVFAVVDFVVTSLVGLALLAGVLLSILYL